MKIINFLKRKILPSRELSEDAQRKDLLQKLPKGGIIGEIGVWKGAFSHQILEISQPKQLHLIDPWTFQTQYPDRLYGGNDASAQADMDAIYHAVVDHFKPHTHVHIHRGYSHDVLSSFEDDSFDWVYIDGDHSFEAVLQDLELAFAKVKPGGYIVGDDYHWKENDTFPVQAAVEAFKQQTPLRSTGLIGSQFVLRMND